MPQTATLVAIPHALDASSAAFAEVQAGQTIAQMLGHGVADTCAVTVGGYPVPRELWTRVRPKAGAMIHVTIYPQGGSGAKWARSVLMIVIAVVAVVTQQYELFGAYSSIAAAGTGAVR